MNGWYGGGSTADHISISITAPPMLARFAIIPNVKPKPINNRPIMNIQSTNTFPAMLWYIEANGPFVARAKNPYVGEFPNSHDLFGAVEKPSPKILSKKAHKNIKPIEMRNIPQI